MHTLIIMCLIALNLLIPFLYFFFTPLEEGKVKYIMRGKTFYRLVFSLRNTAYDQEGDLIIEQKGGHGHRGINFFGYTFINRFVERVDWFTWSWKELRLNKETKKMEVIVREEKTNFLYVSTFPYALSADDAEDLNGKGVAYSAEFGLRAIKPYMARFEIGAADATIQSLGMAGTKNYFGSVKFADALSEIRKGGTGIKKEEEGREFSEVILEMNTKLPANPIKNFITSTGHIIDYANLINVDLAGINKEKLVEAIQAQQIETELGEAAVTKATYKKKVRAQEAEAESNYEDKVGGAKNRVLKERYRIKTYNDRAVAVSANEAIENNQNLTQLAVSNSGGNGFLVTVPMTPSTKGGKP